MGSRLTGILLWGILAIGASPASAGGRDWGIEYLTRTTGSDPVPPATAYRPYPSESFIALMSRPFAPLMSPGAKRQNGQFHDFRRPGSEIVIPMAFRRPEQLQLGFSIRF